MQPYCSVEASTSIVAAPQVSLLIGFSKAKLVYHVNSKKVEVYAQEASQIIGIIHQREGNARKLGPNARFHEEYVTPRCPT